MKPIFIVNMDINTMDIDLLEQLDVCYALELDFADEEIIPPENRNILHLSKEGKKGVQTYKIVEHDNKKFIEHRRTEMRKRKFVAHIMAKSCS